MLPLETITAIRATLPGMELTAPSSVIRNAAELEGLGAQMPASPGALRPASPAQNFASLLDNLVTEVNAKQQQAKGVVQELQSGGNVPLHQAVIAMEEASVSFQLMVEVRNKMLEAYHEIMRMQV
jgi:flagellar hook-basal body complex protein FliE